MGRRAVSWWRVEIDKTGKVLSCRAVESRGQDKATVIYIAAKSELTARHLGKREYRKLQQRKQRAGYAERGLCNSCGGFRLEGKGYCATCKARADRYNAAKRGKEPPAKSPGYVSRPPTLWDTRQAKVEREAARMRRERQFGVRLVVLEEVAEAWRSSNTHAEFCHWLANEIVKITGEAPKTEPEQSPFQSSLAGATS